MESEDSVKKLETDKICESLSYVNDALKLSCKAPKQRTDWFFGFTLDSCLLHDRGRFAGRFPRAVDWATNHPRRFNALMEKLTLSVIEYLKMQAKLGLMPFRYSTHGRIYAPKSLAGNGHLNGLNRLLKT